MIVRCPRCTSEQPFSAGSLDPRGEMVRCAVCGTRWLARPFEGLLPLADSKDTIAEAVVIDEEGPPFPQRQRRPSVARQLPLWRGSLTDRRLKALGIIFGVVAAFFVLRAPIVAALPETTGLPTGVGLLEFQRVHSETVRFGAVNTLYIQGEVVNRSPQHVALPAVEITLRSPSGAAITSWRVQLATDSLGAGRSIGFRSALAEPPPEATQVTLNLTERDSGLP
jgi:predicted Zn finger-like uncharacterized protein